MFYIWLVLVFLMGAAVGSFLNVCFYRLPYEKSLLWPSSRCARCMQPIRLRDNLPLLSYWILRGRCRTCGARFSPRYFFVELFTALSFTGLFYLEIKQNVLGLPFIAAHDWDIKHGVIPLQAWAVFGHHAILASFLILVSLCDLNDMEIPLTVTLTGTLIGLLGAACFPWPFPNDVPPPRQWAFPRLAGLPEVPRVYGLYAWPVWYPLPEWLPAGDWRLGLATGLAGAAAGMAVLRGVRFLFGLGRGKEGLGMGDADLMMMAGSFIGWQPVLVSFFVGVFPALFFGLIQLARRGDQPMPFGPALALGVMLTVLAWPRIGPDLAFAFFSPLMLTTAAVVGAVGLLVMSFLFRLRGGGEADKAA